MDDDAVAAISQEGPGGFHDSHASIAMQATGSITECGLDTNGVGK